MSFSDGLYISGIQMKKPENEGEWTRKILDILLFDPKGNGKINFNNNREDREGNMSR